MLRALRYLVLLLTVYVLAAESLKPAKIKKRKPKFLQDRESQLAQQARSTLTVEAQPTKAPVSPSEVKVDIEVLKKIDESKCPRKSKKGDTIRVHYIGYLPDGSQFDSSIRKGKPSEFVLGSGTALPAWDAGLNDMCIGEIRELKTPADISGLTNSNLNELSFKVELSEIVGYELPPEIIRDEL